jgi:type III pantothenate kinase
VNVDIVADVGNSRIKWGVCAHIRGAPAVIRRTYLKDEPKDWERQLARWKEQFPLWKKADSLRWALAGVHPQRCDRLREWLVSRGDRVVTLDRFDRLPLTVDVDEPERVGMDRLLNAVAAATKLLPGQPGILVDAGSAVTVDWLDEAHVFHGGAIFPGVRMMARSLHDYTALLPEITLDRPAPSLPGRSTVSAMQAGIFWAVLGGIEAVACRLCRAGAVAPRVFLTGGDAEWMVLALDANDPEPWMAGFVKTLWPEQTLEGIRLSAEALPS